MRISFAGGGSDLPAFYKHEPGAVTSTAIDKYIYITVNKKFDHKIRASYSVTEIVDSVDELKHELIREALRMVELDGGVEIVSISDIPSQGTGLGSSSAYTVGLLNALYAYKGNRVEAERLAQEACQIEIEICNKPIGKQDQYIATYGGFQHIQFNQDESVFLDLVDCLPDTKRELHKRLLLMYTGLTRSTAEILSEQSGNTENNEDKRQALRTMVKLAQDLRDALEVNDWGSFGEIVHQGWLKKKEMASGITNSRIDGWYEQARQHGAIGGKITGAGGGGFMLLYAPPECHTEIVRALPELRRLSFRFDGQGSSIVYAEENSR